MQLKGMTKQNAYKLAKQIKQHEQEIIQNRNNIYLAQPSLFDDFIFDEATTLQKGKSYFILFNQLIINNKALQSNQTIKKLAEYIYLSAKEKYYTTDDLKIIYNGKYRMRVQENDDDNIWLKKFSQTFRGVQYGNNEIEFDTSIARLCNTEIGRRWANQWDNGIQIQVVNGPYAAFYFEEENSVKFYCTTWISSFNTKFYN